MGYKERPGILTDIDSSMTINAANFKITWRWANDNEMEVASITTTKRYPPDGLWHLAIGVRDATNNEIRMYVDGVKFGPATYSGTNDNTPSVNSKWSVGDRENIASTSRRMAGSFDGLAIYETVAANDLKAEELWQQVRKTFGWQGPA